MSHIDTYRPRTGRIIAEDDVLVNVADNIRGEPINIARGMKPGAMPFSGYGERTSSGAESNYPIWPDGAIVIPPLGGVQMSIVSTSADDAVGGAGITHIEIHYNDGGNNLTSEIVALNGLTPALTTATDVQFIQCMHIHATGGSLVAAGTITASNGGTTYSVIPAGDTRCTSAYRMVPAGKRLLVAGGIVSSISGTSATSTRVRMVASAIDTHTYAYPHIYIPFATVGAQDGAVSFTMPVPAVFDAGTVVGATHTSDKGATISVMWSGWLEAAT